MGPARRPVIMKNEGRVNKPIINLTAFPHGGFTKIIFNYDGSVNTPIKQEHGDTFYSSANTMTVVLTTHNLL